MRSVGVSGANGLIGAEESGSSLTDLAAGAAIDAPVIEAHGDIEQEGVGSGEVKIKDARQLTTVEQRVVAKEISVHRPLRELLVGGGRRNRF